MFMIYLDGLGKIGFFKQAIRHGEDMYGTNGDIDILKNRVISLLKEQAEENNEEFTEPTLEPIELIKPTEEQMALIEKEEFTSYDKALQFVIGIMSDSE